jgi:RNase P/RNase MRP subunit p29
MKQINEDEYTLLIGDICEIVTTATTTPLFGKLVDVSQQTLTFERKDGRRIVVQKRYAVSVQPTLGSWIAKQRGDEHE